MWIVTSQNLEIRLNQIRFKVKKLIASKSNCVKVWKKLREEHFCLIQMCKDVNDAFGYLLLTSFFSNIFLLLVNTNASLKTIKTGSNRSIVAVSAVLITMFRLLLMCIFGASISERNADIAKQMLSIPFYLSNTEVR